MHTYRKGQELILASRARDDNGDIQPTIDQETLVVGVEAVYHRNAVETWKVEKDGKITHVEIRSQLDRKGKGPLFIKGEA
jgi:sulfane dehydrogenase subunit SoxC